MSLNHTPTADRLHITLLGRRNSGKSSLVNALTGQNISVVSDIAGTTTDPVYKAMEIPGLGPCVFIDTAGLDDEGELGTLRIGQTLKAMEKTDIALLVCCHAEIDEELRWLELLRSKNIPTLLLLNKTDILTNIAATAREIEEKTGLIPIPVSAKCRTGIDAVCQAILDRLPDLAEQPDITSDLVHGGDLVLLVMPQDIQAPKGRLILPQVQTLRELLDKKCLVMSCTTDKLDATLAALARPPHLIITDSQVFKTVFAKKPAASKLTSFSVLFAQHKGDIHYYIESAAAIDGLTATSRVLIAEACTHAPLSEDIGRVKIPRLLRQRIGEKLHIDLVSGADFPADPSHYDLVIHCGACMFNRKHVLHRIAQCKTAGVPMTNYGVAIAYVSGILDKIDY